MYRERERESESICGGGGGTAYTSPLALLIFLCRSTYHFSTTAAQMTCITATIFGNNITGTAISKIKKDVSTLILQHLLHYIPSGDSILPTIVTSDSVCVVQVMSGSVEVVGTFWFSVSPGRTAREAVQIILL